MTGIKRLNYNEFEFRIRPFEIIKPRLLSYGDPFDLHIGLLMIKESGHGAIDPVEGIIWRVERKGEVDFLVKYVRHDKEDGKYFAEKNDGKITWNLGIEKYI